ncbi:MAG: HEAT repeat domain-containing protein, partial [Armatimonadetes bacterium]|nr:HEAT repeat domain-containing protein [Armatimonadota bacterium]
MGRSPHPRGQLSEAGPQHEPDRGLSGRPGRARAEGREAAAGLSDQFSGGSEPDPPPADRFDLLAYAEERLLRGYRWEVQPAAADLLGFGPDALAPLCRALVSPGALVRMHAAEALGQLGDPRPLPGLRRALRDPDPAVRGHVARALGRLGDLLGAAALMAALDDRSPFVRAEAAGALGVLECRSATPSLRDLLEDSSPLVRVSAATSLASLGESNALPVLAELCRDGDPTVRLAAIRAFRVLRAADSAAPLLAALHDPIGAVRGQAFEALVLLGEPAIPGLCRLLGDPTPAVQVLAARILHDMAAVN